MGGSQAHEFMVLNPAGEDVLVLCEACDYAANRQVAVVPKPDPAPEEPLPLEEVETPGHDDDRDAGGVPRRRRGADGQGRVLRDRRRPARRRPSSAATTRSTRPSSVNAVKATGGLRPATGRGDQGRRHGARLRLADRGARHGRRRRRARRRARPTSSPAPTASGLALPQNVNVPRDYAPDVVADITEPGRATRAPAAARR